MLEWKEHYISNLRISEDQALKLPDTQLLIFMMVLYEAHIEQLYVEAPGECSPLQQSLAVLVLPTSPKILWSLMYMELQYHFVLKSIPLASSNVALLLNSRSLELDTRLYPGLSTLPMSFDRHNSMRKEA